MTIKTAIGLMSGTSMDGIDAALIRTDGVGIIEDIAALHLPYSIEFQQLLKITQTHIQQQHGNIQQASLTCGFSLNDVFTQSLQLHYQAVLNLLQQTKMRADQIDVVGFHGQTFYHNPAAKITVQVGDGIELSRKLGIRVVSNFRSNDVAHGGQGAPFAPIFHQTLAVRDTLFPCIVVNCGGVANISVIYGPNPEDLLGYDSGPGNGLLDSFVKQRTQHRETCDLNGKYGSKGSVNPEILELLMQHSYRQIGVNYFEKLPPKSLDVQDFELIPQMANLSLADGCATLAAFTAKAIVTSMSFIRQPVTQWVLAGGGWNNPVILAQLKYYLAQHNPNIKVNLAAELGWNGQALEGQLIAFLAVRRLQELPISFPKTTNVPYPLIGGDICEVC